MQVMKFAFFEDDHNTEEILLQETIVQNVNIRIRLQGMRIYDCFSAKPLTRSLRRRHEEQTKV